MIPLFLLLLRCVFKGKVTKTTLILLSSLVFVISLASTVGNTAWNTYFKKNLDRYNAFSAIVKADYFDIIPDGSIIYIPDYNGIHNDMEITKSFAKIYTTRDIYFENKEENLDFSKNIICMRYDHNSHAVIIGNIDESFMCNDVYICGEYNVSLPETIDMKNIF
jgi:3D (Asp-Asp-Asp) domain-containing protein